MGVGDVFAAAYVAKLRRGYVEAGWRAAYAAGAYSQTTDPDLFKTYVQRDMKLTLADIQQLGGCSYRGKNVANIQSISLRRTSATATGAR